MLPSRNIILISSTLALLSVGCCVAGIPTDHRPLNSDAVVQEGRTFNSSDRTSVDANHVADGAQRQQGRPVLASSEKFVSGVLKDASTNVPALEDTFSTSASLKVSPLEDTYNTSASAQESLLEDTYNTSTSPHASLLEDTSVSSVPPLEIITFLSTGVPLDASVSLTTSITSVLPTSSELSFTAASDTTSFFSTQSFSFVSTSGQNDDTTRSLSYINDNFSSDGQISESKAQLFLVTTPIVETTEANNNIKQETHKFNTGSTKVRSPSPSLNSESFPIQTTASPKLASVVETPSLDDTESITSKNVRGISNPPAPVREIAKPPGNLFHLRGSESSLTADTLSNSTNGTIKDPETHADGLADNTAYNSHLVTGDNKGDASNHRVAQSISDKPHVNGSIADTTLVEKKRSVDDVSRIRVITISEDGGTREGNNFQPDNMKVRYRYPQRNSQPQHPLFDKNLNPYTIDGDESPLGEDTARMDLTPNYSNSDNDAQKPALKEQTAPAALDVDVAKPATILRKTNQKVKQTATSVPPDSYQDVDVVHHVDEEVTDKIPSLMLPTRVKPLFRTTLPLPNVADQLDTRNSNDFNNFTSQDGDHINEDSSPKPLPTEIKPLVRSTSPLPVNRGVAGPNTRNSDADPEKSNPDNQNSPGSTNLAEAAGEGQSRPSGSGNPSDQGWDSSSVRVRTPVGEMDTRTVGLVVLMLMVVSSLLVIGLITVAVYWIKAKLEVRRLDREMRTACLQGLEHGFADQGL